jgi:hypothetical protein
MTFPTILAVIGAWTLARALVAGILYLDQPHLTR